MTSVTPTFSSDGTNIVLTSPNSSNGYQRGDLSFLNGLDNFKMSMIVATPSAFGFQINDEDNLDLFTSESRWILSKTNVAGTWNQTWLYQTLDTTKEYILEITVNGTSIGLKILNLDGTEIVNTNKTVGTTMNRFGFCWSRNGTFKFRDLKIRQL